MPSAILRESISSRSNVDAEKGIVYGCRLAEVGKLAVFAGLDGKPVEIKITPALVDSLLAICSEDNRLNAHWTHKHVDGREDALLSRVATWRNFRKDENGNLIADAFTAPGTYREAILHWAENDPQGMMVSMVFDYTGGRDNPIAESVRAADFVAKGAATSALLSAFAKTAKLDMPDNLPPDKTPAPDNTPTPPFTPEQVTAIQQMIQAALNPPDVDASAPPAMFAAITKLIGHRVTAGATEAATLAEARFVKSIGGTAVLKDFSDRHKSPNENPLRVAVTAQLAAGAPNRGVAIARALRDKPELESFRATLDAA